MIGSGLPVALLRSIGGRDEVPFGLASAKLTLFAGEQRHKSGNGQRVPVLG